ncbi:hypothetical protein LCGC14_1817720 [marine sediment metagenome]|uniref:Uncharacterized protein n=1 Tax=marine sediment metagenome TaxID=412755 RepID=A0A0F9GJW0_9ZZZZ
MTDPMLVRFVMWPWDRIADILMLIGWGRRGLATIRRYRRRYRKEGAKVEYQ